MLNKITSQEDGTSDVDHRSFSSKILPKFEIKKKKSITNSLKFSKKLLRKRDFELILLHLDTLFLWVIK
jgi:hypothetical protein